VSAKCCWLHYTLLAYFSPSAYQRPLVCFCAGAALCTQLSTLCKLTSLTAGERPTQHLHAMLPALLMRLRRLQCAVSSFHLDAGGLRALPVLSQLSALEVLHMEASLAGDYNLAFPPSLKVHKIVCMYTMMSPARQTDRLTGHL
jgi:hypothetical protein